MNRERVLSDAKARALEMVQVGYKPPVPRTDIPAPGENILATLKLGVHLMRQGEYISDHEVKIGNKVAEVLCGGAVSPGTPVSEQYLLDLEREGFKSLCGEKKTQERIAFTLKTGQAAEELEVAAMATKLRSACASEGSYDRGYRASLKPELSCNFVASASSELKRTGTCL